MKKLIFISIAILLTLPVFCQEEKLQKLENLENKDTTKTETEGIIKSDTIVKKNSVNKKDTVEVKVGDEIFSVKEMGDETRIKVGKKEYRVVEDNDGVVVYRSSHYGSHKKNYERFRGHLGGLELGFNSLLTDFFSTSLKPEDNYFDLNTAKSYYFDFLLPCLNIGFTRHFGIATTLGINFNKYDKNENTQ